MYIVALHVQYINCKRWANPASAWIIGRFDIQNFSFFEKNQILVNLIKSKVCCFGTDAACNLQSKVYLSLRN